MKNHILTLLSLFFVTTAIAQIQMPLYLNNIPNSNSFYQPEAYDINENGDTTYVRDVNVPTLTIYPAKAKGDNPAVIIFPGGGYTQLSIKTEGVEVARKLNELGFTAIVVKYRLPNDKYVRNKRDVPLQDAQQAIYLVRKNAVNFGINPNNIGVMGFSAGGHLASTILTHYDKYLISNKEKISLRPNFGVLLYPVISFQQYVNEGTRLALLDKKINNQKLIKYFSANTQVNSNTPPIMLVHSLDDDVVHYKNSVLLYDALTLKNVKTKIILSDKGGHGYGIFNSFSDLDWMKEFKNWISIPEIKM